MVKGILFDMDGLMIDSEQVTFECFRDVLKKQFLEVTPAYYATTIGLNHDAGKKRYLEEFGKDFDFDKALIEMRELRAKRYNEEGVPLKKGLLHLLDYLKEKGIECVVASSSSRKTVKDTLKRAGVLSYFKDIVCGDDITHSKPDPEIFLEGLKKLNLNKDEVLILEDSPAGVEAANRADIFVVCIPDLVDPSKNPKLVINKKLSDLDEVIGLVDEMNH